MPIVQPAQPRHITHKLGDHLQVVIPSRKSGQGIWMFTIFVITWISYVGLFIWMLIDLDKSDKGPVLFLLFCLMFLMILGVSVFYTMLWRISGKEVIEVSNQSITIQRVVLGFEEPAIYLYDHIQELRISSVVSMSGKRHWPYDGWWGLGGLLAFDYGAETVKFGRDLDEAEAKQILSEIQQRFPRYRSPGDLTGLQDL